MISEILRFFFEILRFRDSTQRHRDTEKHRVLLLGR